MSDYPTFPEPNSAEWWAQREESANRALNGHARWRPGSPVMPMGGSYRGGPGVGGPTGPPTPKKPRRWMTAAFIALLVIASASLGAGVSHALSSSPSTTNVSTQGGTVSGGTNSIDGENPEAPSTPSYGGTSGSSGLPSGVSGSSGLPSGTSGSSGSSSGVIPGAGAPSDVSSIASKVDPALVDINSTFTYQSAAGAGTGIVLTSNGEILTNNHVVDGATKISVTDIGNGKTYAATVVGYDPSEDIAVLQLVDASGLTTATIGNSADVKVGEPVVGIGNAGGAGGTPTSAGGAVTALDKDITAADDLDGTDEQLEGLFAVNADIQAGDSGGALVDTAGQVIGIDVAGSSSSSFPVSGTTSSPQGFAIPINDAISTAKQIEAGRGSSLVHIGGTAFLGLLISSSNTEGGPEGGSFGGNNTYFGNSGNTGETSTSGAAVGSVVSGDPAASAGITGGDVITSLAGKTVTSATSLSTILIGYHPGQKVQIAWTSGTGQTQTATITLASGPPA